ncbi:CHAT domain-containing tetratricopeptide repeat protein [Sphingosinicella sp.]|uniref:CHAT domain-containing tetratricopeptide repeat protein n=1 Tax=Sphingosinicella sp. TaxID=1917971 RepID=UPI0040378AE4
MELVTRRDEAYTRGEYDLAADLAASALALAEAAFGPGHPVTLAAVSHLAMVYEAQGRFAEAEPLLIRAAETGERVWGLDDQQTLISLNNLGSFYQAQGRLAEAEPLHIRVIEVVERTLGREHPDTLSALTNLGLLYLSQGRFAEAEPLHLRVLEASERTLGRDHSETLVVVNNLALLYSAQGRYAEAEPLYIRAVEANERTLGREHRTTLWSRIALASCYLDQGRQAEAEPLLTRAFEASERTLGRDDTITLASVGHLADLYQDQGRFTEAEPLLIRLVETSERRFGREDPSTIDAAERLASAQLTSGQGGAAIEPARLAVFGRRSRRASANSGAFAEAQREREERQRRDGFTLLADAAWLGATRDGGNMSSLEAESFAALQDAIAGTTDRAVIQMAVRRVADDTAPRLGTLVRERESLSHQWAANNAGYNAALTGSDAAADAQRQSLPAERARIESRMAQIDAILRQDFQPYFALTRPEALSVAETQAILAPDEAILMVVPTAFGTHVVAVSSTSIEWVRSEWTGAQIDAAVQRLLWDVGANVRVTPAQADQWLAQAGPGYPYDRTTAHNLYLQIVAPVDSVLAGKRHVFITAGGSLTSLPFGILVAAPPLGRDGDPAALRDPAQTRWFADAHALIQIPSIQSLQFLRRFSRPPGERGLTSFVGFGDPVLQGAPAQRARSRGTAGAELSSLFEPGRRRDGGAIASVRQLRLLSRLPGTATELEAIRAALGAPRDALFLAERATETNVRTTDLGSARIIAFATHGLTGGEVLDVAEPGLVFTPPQTPSDADDGLLTASEVSALRLAADWVILSACNTAAGDGTEGAPGLSGLARAFFYAGARNLLASHWPVGDDVAARLTVLTIELLNERPELSRAEALQLAMREVRNDAAHDSAEDSWAHPSAWAPFTLIGDGVR